MDYQKQLDDAVAVTSRVASERGLPESDANGWQELAHAAGMHNNGPYRVLGAWSDDDLTVVLEQNTAPDTAGGPQTIHPPTVVVERHRDGVRVSVAGGDEETLNFVLNDLADETAEAASRPAKRARQ